MYTMYRILHFHRKSVCLVVVGWLLMLIRTKNSVQLALIHIDLVLKAITLHTHTQAHADTWQVRAWRSETKRDFQR